MERLEVLQRVHRQLVELGADILGEKDRRFIEEYHQELNRLAEFSNDISEFVVQPEDWSPKRLHHGQGASTYYSGPLTGREELVVPRSRFERRFRPALQHVHWLIEQEKAKTMAEPSKKPSAILEERSRLLATLIDAYLQHQQAFITLMSDGRKVIHHPGLPRSLEPNWSHIEALSCDGWLILTSGSNHHSWTIDIPTQTLVAFETNASDVALAPAGKQRVEDIKTQVINYFYGGSHNVAAGGSHVTQTITHNVRPADLSSLLVALRELGVSDDDLSYLEATVKSPSPEEADRSAGDRAKAWFASYATAAIAGASGTGLAAAVERMPQIARSIEAFAGTL